MTACPTVILADIGDLVELLVPVIFVIIYGIGGAIKSRLEKKEEQNRQQSLQKIHEARPEPARPSPASQEESLPYAKAIDERPRPVSSPQQKRQGKIADLQRKRMEYLGRISGMAQKLDGEPSPPAMPSSVAVPIKPIQTAVTNVRKKIKAADKISTAMHAGNIVSMLHHKDHLRTAILLTEILGKPIALRDSEN